MDNTGEKISKREKEYTKGEMCDTIFTDVTVKF